MSGHLAQWQQVHPFFEILRKSCLYSLSGQFPLDRSKFLKPNNRKKNISLLLHKHTQAMPSTAPTNIIDIMATYK